MGSRTIRPSTAGMQSRTELTTQKSSRKAAKFFFIFALARQNRFGSNVNNRVGLSSRETTNSIKSMKKTLITFIVAAFAAVTVWPLAAADEKPADKKETAPRAVPLRGKVDSVDKQAKTFKINDRTFHVTADTRIMKAGKPGTFDDVAVGEDVAGNYREGADKKLNVVSLRVGPRPAAPAK